MLCLNLFKFTISFIIISISFEKLEYVKSSNNINQDSINLTISFTDGDGDLGLSNDDINFPYNPYDAIIDENLTWVTLGSANVTPPLYLYLSLIHI